jgi:hypothetical protein
MGRGRAWTDKRLDRISAELRRMKINVSPNTVRRLLDQLGYALHANTKTLAHSHPLRDKQFQVIIREKDYFTRRRLPIISVDTKKKELVGNFKNPGQVWSLAATPVKDHDFRSEALGLAIPYGIYDVGRNCGSVFVGMSHDTPEFAVGNVAQWWREVGRKTYQEADQLLILADSGGSNGARVRAWKLGLQEGVADAYGLAVTVCHYPRGASKWNPVEHRLFSEISKHWAGQPLESYDTIARLIQETKTQTGLRVTSRLVPTQFDTGVKITPAQMSELSIIRHPEVPQWNYTLLPR